MRGLPLRAPGRYAKQLFHDLRMEGAGRGREAAALGIGAFIGCLPVYGAHLLLVVAVGRILRLNRLRMYVAAHISNPLFAPPLLLAEVQTGAWVRRRELHDVTLQAIRATEPWVYGIDLAVGSVIVGTVLGLGIAALTWASVAHAPPLAPHLTRLFDAAAGRFLDVGIAAWEFARAKLRRDPIYAAALRTLPCSGATLVDVGCGQGLALAVLIEAAAAFSAGDWPADRPPPPHFDRLMGIEIRGRIAAMARRALGAGAEIIHDAAPRGLPPQMTAVLVFDVLHLMRPADQKRLIDDIFARLEPRGTVLVRDVDAAGGFGFHAVRISNRLKHIVGGNFRAPFHFRSANEWTNLFTDSGWTVESWPMGQGTPFANVLFKLTKSSSR